MDRMILPPQQWPEAIKKVIREHAVFKPSYGEVRVHTIFDDESGHYQLFYTGWNGESYLDQAVVHLEICDGKIWIHWDGIGEGVVPELIAAGIPHDQFRIAWQAPELQRLTPTLA